MILIIGYSYNNKKFGWKKNLVGFISNYIM